MKLSFIEKFSLVSVLFQGFSKPPSKHMMNAVTVLQMNTLVQREKNDERFSARDEDVESANSNFSPTQLHM